jgi:hypothetical protein
MGGGGGIKHGDDHGHFPEDVVLGQVGDRSYKLQPYEKANIKHIEARLKSGKELTHKELHDFMHYLDHFSHHIKHILQEEQMEHISNIQLERDLRKIAQLMGEISAILERHH